MKNLFALSVCFLILMSLNAQSTDRFIRIIGSSSHIFDSDGIEVELTISEVQANERKAVEAIPFEIVHNIFTEEIKSLGVADHQIKRADFNISKYSNLVSKSYKLELSDASIIDKLVEKKLDGLKLGSTKFTYNNIDPDVQDEMILNAIDDAKRKAKNICKEIDMKLGKILNIEDTSSGCCGELNPSKEIKTKKQYTLNVTFELID